jgi:NADPH oxidase
MVSGWIINELPKWIVFGTWMLLNIALFIFQFYTFQATDRFFYMRLRTREALAFARGPALPINFNAILILLPVCRNLISFIRGTGRCPPRTVKRLLDKNLTFHKAIAWMIVLSSTIHIIAHWYNYERLLATPGLEAFRMRIPWEIRSIPDAAQPDLSGYPGVQPDPITICFVTAAGITGHIITIVLFLMVTSSLEFIRRSYFEVFWYTHHLFIIFLVGLAFHQYQRLLPVQTNFADHVPANCSLYREQDIANDRLDGFNVITGEVVIDNVTQSFCPAAEFTPAPPGSWTYMLGGLIIYTIERIVRFIRGLRKVVIVKVVEHPSKTIEIQMRSKGFFAEAGQYVFVNVPSVALFEWHPFTLTSVSTCMYIITL